MTDSTLPPYRLNMLLAAIVIAIALIQFMATPLFLLPRMPGLAIAIALSLSLSTPLCRALLHEAIHGRLARNKGWNVSLGRVLAIFSGIAFDAIRLGHMIHHRFPRHQLDRADIIEPGKNCVIVNVKFYIGLLGGIYLLEFLYSMVMLFPRRAMDRVAEYVLAEDDSTRDSLHRSLRRGLDRRLGRIRTDTIIVILIYAGAIYLYGWWWWVLALSIALRGLIVSLQDNVAHYATPAVVGAAAHNASASRLIRLFMLNQNFHGVHHERPEIPWNMLPDSFKRTGREFAGNYFALLVKQFHGPVPRHVPSDLPIRKIPERDVVAL